MPRESNGTFSIVVFPFLKTSMPVKLGELEFRPTTDTEGLPQEQATAVREIAGMLFLRDDLRIAVASYAVCPYVDMTYSIGDVPALSNVQAVVSYLYASPHETNGDIFFNAEQCTMVVFSPGSVSPYLIRPDINVVALEDRPELSVEGLQSMRGYSVLYNFCHQTWAAPGSRLYGPAPDVILNVGQDLALDFETATAAQGEDLIRLLRLLKQPSTDSAARALTAIKWYNEANREACSDDASLVNLAIAFESLLGLPQMEKTDRLVDSVALLLGRVPRLDEWARQFYDARSRVVHEGHAAELRFVAKDTRKQDGLEYQPLVSYGRRVFRLCLLTLLRGAELAQQAGLEEKFVTNQERFRQLCAVLDNQQFSALERLHQSQDIIGALDRYSFLGEAGLTIDAMLGATSRALTCLLEANILSEETRKALIQPISSLGTGEQLKRLEGIEAIRAVLSSKTTATEAAELATVGLLVKVVWHYVFMHYMWLKRDRNQHSDGA